MEQLYNAMMTNVQVPQTGGSVQKKDSADKDGFQKLLEQKQGADTASGRPEQQEQRPEAEQKPAETQEAGKGEELQQTQPAPKSERELEDQMALAAMAMLQNPVVPVEQVMTPEVQAEAVVEEAAPLAEEAVILTAAEPEVLAPETKQAAEIPVEGGEVRTEEQAAVKEDVPQAVEAPEAARETEERTVEVKVETGDAPREDGAESETEDTPELQDAEAETPVFKDVKAAPVKVGESAPRAEKAQEPVETQVGNRLTEALAKGETHVELQLNPENLGKVTVEMTWSEKGGLVVQLHAENRDTQNLLSKNLSGLEALLGRETQQEVRVEVPRQEESQRQDLFDQQQEQQRRQQQEQRRNRESDGETFMQQLRLGLIPVDGE